VSRNQLIKLQRWRTAANRLVTCRNHRWFSPKDGIAVFTSAVVYICLNRSDVHTNFCAAATSGSFPVAKDFRMWKLCSCRHSADIIKSLRSVGLSMYGINVSHFTVCVLSCCKKKKHYFRAISEIAGLQQGKGLISFLPARCLITFKPIKSHT
jgi:hypothetical protein